MALAAPRFAPDAPDGPTRSSATAQVSLRFEDVTQDGRLVLESLPQALEPTLWRGVLADDPGAKACLEHGIVPILTRFVLEGTPGPFSPDVPVEARAACRIARSTRGQFILDMWSELLAPVRRTYGTAPPRDAPPVAAGRVFAEHVLTRPFAAPGERRVTSLDFPGAPDVRDLRPASPAPESIAAPPAGANPLDSAFRPDDVTMTFGIVHTDSNMHVNSLAYLRLFEEAALRRFVQLGRDPRVLARRLDIAYRKPCFAGQSVRVALQAFEHEGRLGVAGMLLDATEPRGGGDGGSEGGARPHAFVRMTFE